MALIHGVADDGTFFIRYSSMDGGIQNYVLLSTPLRLTVLLLRSG
jgi:hypothetical protein